MNRTMAIAKHDFKIGYLTSYEIVRPFFDNAHWCVSLGTGLQQGMLCDARTKEPRQFKTLDSAVKAVEEIGFEVTRLSC